MKASLDKIQVQRLVKIGLSLQEAEIYLLLLQKGPLTAKGIAEYLNILPNAVYRSAEKLEGKGLISIATTTKKLFHALSPTLALASYAKKQALSLEKEVKEFSGSLTDKQSSSTQVKVIFGKEPTYLTSAGLIRKLKEECLLISIGELIPPYLLLSIKNAAKRDVKIKLIVHRYDNKNKETIENFRKNGMEVRHYAGEGFHFGIYDQKKVLLIVNNPQQTDERIGILMTSKGLTKAIREYFYFIWNEAIKI